MKKFFLREHGPEVDHQFSFFDQFDYWKEIHMSDIYWMRARWFTYGALTAFFTLWMIGWYFDIN